MHFLLDLRITKASKMKHSSKAALAVLQSTGIDILEAAILAKEALSACRGKIGRARRCLAAGAEALRQQERTVSFEKAVEAALEARKDRRIRTVYDFEIAIFYTVKYTQVAMR